MRAAAATWLHGAGWLANEQGEYSLAEQLLEESLATYRRIEDRAGEARVVVLLGDTKHRQGEVERAAELLATGHALSRELGDEIGEAFALNNLGHLAISQGNLEDATTSYTEALGRYREAGDTQRSPRSCVTWDS